MADKAFNQGDKEKARQLYLKAAEMNNADAHYSIAYKFVVSKEESLFHYSEAAKAGHAKALNFALDELFFRANSLTNANPELAYDIIESAKKSNPAIEIFDEENTIATIKKCMEADTFDGKEFIKKYGLNETELENNYAVWELAEEASRKGRFGLPDPMLVLQLVCRGGLVPAELSSAVDFAYNNWKENKIAEFHICDYITSGIGQTYCAEKEEEGANEEFRMRIKALASKLKNNSGALLPNAFEVASKFIEEKAWNEEGHDGTGYIAWGTASILQQKTEFLNLIEKINKGINADTLIKNNDADKKLNETYQKVINKLKIKSISGMNFSIDATKVRSVQRLWIPYRDTSAKLFTRIDPSVNENTWKIWLTQIRIQGLNQILDMEE
jgi:uncharacterized protein YecT (DUF1311 family)